MKIKVEKKLLCYGLYCNNESHIWKEQKRKSSVKRFCSKFYIYYIYGTSGDSNVIHASRW